MRRAWTVDRIMQNLIVVLAIGAILWGLNYMSGVLTPFFAAFLLAYILDPLVTKLQKKVRHRIIAVIIVIVGFFAVVLGAGYVFIPMVVGEVRHLGVLIPKMFSDSTWVSRISSVMPGDLWTSIKGMISWDKVAAYMRSIDFWKSVQSVANNILPSAWGLLAKGSNVVAWISGTALVCMYLIFIMLDMPKILHAIVSLFPNKYRGGLSDFSKEVDKFMGSYFRAQSLVALCVGILFAISFALVGLPMGVAFGLLIGVLNMVPYLQLTSIPLAFLLAVVHALETGMPFWEVCLIVTFIYLLIQVIQDFILVPKIVGGSMNLPPVGILLSISIWGKLLGFLGLIVAIPFTCICLVYVDKIQKKAEAVVDEITGPGPEA